ncbi:MAG TPA: hypothetical protein VGY54_22045 [Polyangiaceae bacterium]|nr:hypothetical protein [Polyangiaceae bacterium]
MSTSLLDHPLLASRLFFPRRVALEQPYFVTAADGVTRPACLRTTVPNAYRRASQGFSACPILSLVSWPQTTVFAIVVGLAAGCAEHLRSVRRSPSWSTGVLFWPPPLATSTWIAEPSTLVTLGDEARLIEDALRREGYTE